MKYSLSSRLPQSVLKDCDEIRFLPQDYDQIENFLDWKQDIVYYFAVYDDKIVDKLISMKKKKDNIIICTEFIENLQMLQEKGFKTYFGMPINDYCALDSMIKMGVYAVSIAAPLTHDLERVSEICKKHNVQIKMFPNVALRRFFPKNEIINTWVRPEDVKYYEPYIDTFEFNCVSLREEEILFKVYAKDRIWNGNLNLLIKGLNENIDNRALKDDFGEMRINCQQKCCRTGNCHYCYNAFRFAKAIQKEKEKRDGV